MESVDDLGPEELCALRLLLDDGPWDSRAIGLVRGAVPMLHGAGCAEPASNSAAGWRITRKGRLVFEALRAHAHRLDPGLPVGELFVEPNDQPVLTADEAAAALARNALYPLRLPT